MGQVPLKGERSSTERSSHSGLLREEGFSTLLPVPGRKEKEKSFVQGTREIFLYRPGASEKVNRPPLLLVGKERGGR